MFTSYVIYNKIRDKIYIGYTADLIKRLKRHNKKLPSKTASFTSKNNGSWGLIYNEDFSTRKEAIRREKELKSFKGREFIRSLIAKNNQVI
jgi:putative endonuclease